MGQRLRIAVADDEPDVQQYFGRMLPRLGHEVVCIARNGRDLVDRCRHTPPDLIITDVKMPELDGLAAAAEICRERPVAVILVSAHCEPPRSFGPEISHVMARLVKPIKQSDLEPTITLAVRRFQQLQQVQREACDERQAPRDREVIEQAQRLLMQRARLDELSALGRLQAVARNHQRRLVEVAEAILLAEQACAPEESPAPTSATG